MGVENIYEFLKKNSGNFFSTVEIGKAIGLSDGSVSRALGILKKRKEVVCKDTYAVGGNKVPRYTVRTTEPFV